MQLLRIIPQNIYGYIPMVHQFDIGMVGKSENLIMQLRPIPIKNIMKRSNVD